MNQINKFRGKYNFLSNFYATPILYNDIEYPSVEHAYQAQKTTDYTKRYYISTLESSADAKVEGNKLKVRDNWNDIKVGVMKDLLLIKFSQEPLKTLLLNTGDDILIEGNTWGDTFWGVYNNQGINLLGILLMYTRHFLRYG